MRDPHQYTKAVVVSQTGVFAVYAIIGGVVYYYCGTYVSSPALGSAGGVVKVISYAFALPGLLATLTIVAHVRETQRIRRKEARLGYTPQYANKILS